MLPSSSPLIFDRALVKQHMVRARPDFPSHSALFDDTGAQIADRIGDIIRDFSMALDISPFPFLAIYQPSSYVVSANDILYDEELLPFAPKSFDLIASNLALQWINDVPGTLIQIRSALKPDGLFIAALIGGRSLYELRSCLVDAELSVTGGISPRLSPTIDSLTASTLLQRAGFNLPVVDSESVTLLYPDMLALMHDLRGMGQTNAHKERLRYPTRRAVFIAAAKLYQERFADAKGRIPATFEIIFLHGWR